MAARKATKKDKDTSSPGKDSLKKRAAGRKRSGSPRKAGRKTTMDAILTAAEQQFASRGFDGTTVRDIAARAGVTHALVHRYFGTKVALFRAVLMRNENIIRDASTGVDDLAEAAMLMAREGLKSQRSYLRILVSSALQGVPYDRSIARFSATERLIELARSAAADGPHLVAGRDAEAAEADRRLAVAMAVSVLAGWVSMQPWLEKAAGIEGLDDKTKSAGVERAVKILLDGWLKTPADATSGAAD